MLGLEKRIFMKADIKTALVTGGNKGIGFEVCRQLGKQGYHVILAGRDHQKVTQAACQLAAEGLNVTPLQLDVTSETDTQSAYAYIAEHFGRLDVLINNAGIMIDPSRHPPDEEGSSAFHAKLDTIRKSLETNTLGAFRLCQKFVPLMMKNRYGRVVNVSSGMGQLSEMNGGWPGYRISKTALNAVTRIFSDEAQDNNVLINSVCPGWVKTDMGGEDAELSTAEGADTIVWLATLPDGGPTGGFFRERERIEW